jgi:hypothetical protein
MSHELGSMLPEHFNALSPSASCKASPRAVRNAGADGNDADGSPDESAGWGQPRVDAGPVTSGEALLQAPCQPYSQFATRPAGTALCRRPAPPRMLGCANARHFTPLQQRHS